VRAWVESTPVLGSMVADGAMTIAAYAMMLMVTPRPPLRQQCWDKVDQER